MTAAEQRQADDTDTLGLLLIATAIILVACALAYAGID